jgi:hypothetical protein
LVAAGRGIHFVNGLEWARVAMPAHDEARSRPVHTRQERAHAEIAVRDPDLAGPDLQILEQRTLLRIGVFLQDDLPHRSRL